MATELLRETKFYIILQHSVCYPSLDLDRNSSAIMFIGCLISSEIFQHVPNNILYLLSE